MHANMAAGGCASSHLLEQFIEICRMLMNSFVVKVIVVECIIIWIVKFSLLKCVWGGGGGGFSPQSHPLSTSMTCE